MGTSVRKHVDERKGRKERTSQAMAGKPRTIDDYLATVSDDQRAALEQLRKTIRIAAPKAAECISYGIPAYRQNGMLVGFGATTKHCAFYLMSSSTLADLETELEDYDTSKGTIRFQRRPTGWAGEETGQGPDRRERQAAA